jgi:predicted ATP-dependent endonuclease of OLD family
MKIESVTIHNFRSIKDARFNCFDYNVVVGANNAGKSNILTALRIFYEDEKYNEKTDFPKFDTDDDESWIEIEYFLTEDEFHNIKDEYKNEDRILKVRKYLRSKNKNRVKQNQSNIYGYEQGKLSENLFYGAKNISESKLGSVIYIPEITTTDEALRLSGPSPLRNILSFVMNKVIETSESYEKLSQAFEDFNDKFRDEASKDGFSLNRLKEEINENLKEWEIELNFNINPIKSEGIIKNLVTHNVIDKNLKEEVDIKFVGQGLQRQLIYTLLKLSSKYIEKKIYQKKDFSPELTLILFEEPEAFLHPNQQESLNISLKALSSINDQQIIITTHSPIFVSKNIEDIPSLIRLKRENGITHIFQVSDEKMNQIFMQNNELTQLFKSKLKDPSVDQSTKKEIKKVLGDTEDDIKIQEEGVRYLLWLDYERCSAFFADIVLICEGASEKIFIDYLVKNKWEDLRAEKFYVLDAMGKFNIHRYMNLFKELGINHSILYDKDEDMGIQKIINDFIESKRNIFTKSIDFFDKDLEFFLGIEKPSGDRKDRRPLNVLWKYKNNRIELSRLEELKEKISNLIRN